MTLTRLVSSPVLVTVTVNVIRSPSAGVELSTVLVSVRSELPEPEAAKAAGAAKAASSISDTSGANASRSG